MQDDQHNINRKVKQDNKTIQNDDTNTTIDGDSPLIPEINKSKMRETYADIKHNNK